MLFSQQLMPATMTAGITMGMGAPLFLLMWVVMMIAMMFPSAAPMILTFARVQAHKQQRGQGIVPTWLFVGAYLFIWALSGMIAYGLAAFADSLARLSPWLMMHSAIIGGALIVGAGLYQLSPLKRACLSKCRSPLHFVLGAWRDGYSGALRMGMEHGLYCLGCCWLLFLMLFPLGVMNLGAMLIITLLIFAEKSLPAHWRVTHITAAALIGYGVLVMVQPELLPVGM
ncbi:MAG TPA: DUF2182 domain-containing protein [Gammaproteobacteria bacterium]|nr:DUF2182 domain-containing protein [Gammaproteobacteria bacterium]